jgi:hypothetical protein
MAYNAFQVTFWGWKRSAPPMKKIKWRKSNIAHFVVTADQCSIGRN